MVLLIMDINTVIIERYLPTVEQVTIIVIPTIIQVVATNRPTPVKTLDKQKPTVQQVETPPMPWQVQPHTVSPTHQPKPTQPLNTQQQPVLNNSTMKQLPATTLTLTMVVLEAISMGNPKPNNNNLTVFLSMETIIQQQLHVRVHRRLLPTIFQLKTGSLISTTPIILLM